MRIAVFATTALILAANLAGEASAEEICDGTSLPVRTAPGRSSPYVDLIVEGRTGPFLLDYGAGGSSLEHGLWSFADDDRRWRGTTSDGVRQIYLASNFPGWVNLEVTWRIYDRNVSVDGAGDQHGVIGTDMVGNQNLVFDYRDAARPSVTISAWGAVCEGDRLRSLGFHRIDQTGHWTADGTALGPNGIHNGPVVFVAIARSDAPDIRLGAQAWAQIDTGYENDRVPNSIDINQAMLDRLTALDLPLSEQQGIPVTECNVTQTRRVFILPGHVLRVEDEAGKRITQLDTFSFVLKPPPVSGCGGISGASVPAAQIGASFLRTFATTVFAGRAKEVWIRP